MRYNEYVDITHQVNAAVEAHDYPAALKLLEALVTSDLPDVDKSIMWINVAVVWEKMGNEVETMRAYDRAVQYEKPHKRCLAQASKADYLYRLKRVSEARAIYEELLMKDFLTLGERERFEECRQLAGN